MPQTIRDAITDALVEAYFYINQSKSAEKGEPAYWEWKRQQVMTRCLAAFADAGIDYRKQDQGDR